MSDSEKDTSTVCNRRQFLPLLLNEIAVYFGSFRDAKPVFQVTDLKNLPDSTLAEIHPQPNPAFEFAIVDGDMWARRIGGDQVEKLFPVESMDHYLFKQFTGEYTLEEIGRRLTRKRRCTRDEGWRMARDAFLSLAGRLLVVPRDPLEEETESGEERA